jgi:hypothetical protein
MKIRVIGLTLLSVLFYASCSSDAAETINAADLDTVKRTVSKIEDETVWSVELEKDRLSQNITSNPELFAQGINLTKENSRILKMYTPAVYPSFTDFGSLDVSKTEYKFITSAEEICSYISSNDQENLFSCFSSNYRFNYVFFVQELKRNWKENMGTDFPEPDVLFERFILGEAFCTENLVQIPVRFYCNKGFLDVTLYMSAVQEKSVYNIKIVRWGKNV